MGVDKLLDHLFSVRGEVASRAVHQRVLFREAGRTVLFEGRVVSVEQHLISDHVELLVILGVAFEDVEEGFLGDTEHSAEVK